jgi:hypothetical protein
MFDDFLEYIPEEKREAFKGLAQKAVIIGSREDAQKHLTENSYLKSEKDAIISRTTESYAQRFKEEKLPGLLDEEYKKKHPPTDPKDQRIAEMEKKFAEMERQAILERRKAEATAKLSELGLPTNLAKFAIAEDENIFANNITELSGLKAWMEEQKKSVLGEKFGNQTTPKTGTNSGGFEKMTVTELMAYAASGPDQKNQVLQWQQTKGK